MWAAAASLHIPKLFAHAHLAISSTPDTLDLSVTQSIPFCVPRGTESRSVLAVGYGFGGGKSERKETEKEDALCLRAHATNHHSGLLRFCESLACCRRTNPRLSNPILPRSPYRYDYAARSIKQPRRSATAPFGRSTSKAVLCVVPGSLFPRRENLRRKDHTSCHPYKRQLTYDFRIPPNLIFSLPFPTSHFDTIAQQNGIKYDNK